MSDIVEMLHQQHMTIIKHKDQVDLYWADGVDSFVVSTRKENLASITIGFNNVAGQTSNGVLVSINPVSLVTAINLCVMKAKNLGNQDNGQSNTPGN